MIKSSYYGSCMAFNKKLLQYALPFPMTNEIGHDLWLGLIGELIGKVCFFDKPLILYRRHQGAFCRISNVEQKSQRALWRKLLGRIIMIRELMKFLLRIKINALRK